MFSLRYPILLAVAIMLLGAPATLAPSQAHAQGFFEALGRLFSGGERSRQRERDRAEAARRARAAARRRKAAEARRPALTFSFAHDGSRHKRFRYSHQTPYGYRQHPYEHGFSYLKENQVRARPRTPETPQGG